LAIVLGVVACGPAIPVDESGTEGDTEGDTDVSTTATTTASTGVTTTDGTSTVTSATTDPVTTDPVTTDPVTTDPVTTDPGTTIVTTDPSDTTDPTGEGLPDGSMCNSGFDCASGECYVIGVLGGICGQCDEDSDCEGGGCSLPNPLASPPTPSVCNDGTYGDGCETDEVCADLLCGLVIDVPGIVQVSTCGECESQSDCGDGFTCEPDIAVAALAGVKRCVANDTLANGQTCDYVENGDEACGSGFCAPADIMGILQIGVCSACEVDADCPSGTCAPPQIDVSTGVPTPGACEP
jgi:hypothetical protein